MMMEVIHGKNGMMVLLIYMYTLLIIAAPLTAFLSSLQELRMVYSISTLTDGFRQMAYRLI